MRIGSFELAVRGSNGVEKVETSEGYVEMEHEEQFALILGNNTSEDVALKVRINGKSVGDFMQTPHSRDALERSLTDDGKFTFYEAGSEEADIVGEAGMTRTEKGLIEVDFVPGCRHLRLRGGDSEGTGYGATRGAGPVRTRSGSSKGYGAGVVGQSGHSDQTFGVGGYIEEDWSRKVTIRLRMVYVKSKSRTSGPRPLPGQATSNRVPPPVE
jgi:hypothetical protein